MSETEDRTERERIAYHESGHAVMAWTFGLELDRVSIVHTEESRGAVRIGSWEGVTEFDDDILRAHALTQLAGEVAVKTLTGTAIDWGQWLDHPGSDINLYNELADHLGWYECDGDVIDFGPVMEERMAEVHDLLVERWAAVEALVAVLLQKNEVSAEDAIRIVGATEVPGPVASVWADFLEERRIEEEFRARVEASSDEPREDANG